VDNASTIYTTIDTVMTNFHRDRYKQQHLSDIFVIIYLLRG